MQNSRLLCTLPLLLVCTCGPAIAVVGSASGNQPQAASAPIRVGARLQHRGAGPAPSLSGCLQHPNLQQRKSTGRVLTVVARDSVTGLAEQHTLGQPRCSNQARCSTSSAPAQARLGLGVSSRRGDSISLVGDTRGSDKHITLEIPGSNSTHVFPRIDVPGHAWVCDRLGVWHIRAAK